MRRTRKRKSRRIGKSPRLLRARNPFGGELGLEGRESIRNCKRYLKAVSQAVWAINYENKPLSSSRQRLLSGMEDDLRRASIAASGL